MNNSNNQAITAAKRELFGGLVTDICLCHLSYQSTPFVIGTIRDAKSQTGKSNVWLRDDGKWTRNETDPRTSLKLGGWNLPNRG